MVRRMAMVALLALVTGCGGSGGSDGPGDVGREAAAPDVAAEIAAEALVPADGAMDGVAPEVGPELAEVVEEGFPPRKLPFEFTRPPEGEPLSVEEVADFTAAVTGVWRRADYFRWLLRTSIGVDPTTKKDDFLAWYNDMAVVKEGNKVTFKQLGGEHNMWIPGSKILSVAVNACALTGDWAACKTAEQYCKGLTASVKGFVWDEEDPAPFLMARAIFPEDQDFALDADFWQDDGRLKAVEFHHAYKEEFGWNAQSFAWPHNPTWGSIWITNMRSKDDVCAIVRSTTFLPYAIADAPFEWVREACQETLDTMVGFNRDIVDSGYYIRTKGQDGVAYKIPDQDLGNYVWYADLDPLNECPARLASDLIAYQEPLTNDCGSGWGSVYDMIAPAGHYYNYPIIWNYHMAALGNALLYGYPQVAFNLLTGMVERMDEYLSPTTKEPGAKNPRWGRDMAILLVQAATFGYPLTWEEARLVHNHWSQGVTEYQEWPNWDLWSPEVADGEYGGGQYRPNDSDQGIPIEAFALFLEYCNSPFKNPAGVSFVDCSRVASPEQW